MNKIDGESILERQDNRQRARHAKRMKRYRQRKILVLILAVLVVAVAGFAILYQAKQSPIKLNGDAAVSYTHLDVYKRQDFGHQSGSAGEDVQHVLPAGDGGSV